MQVPEDPDLLNLMMEDARGVPEVYRPTNYWKVYEHEFLPELRRYGLHDFRRRHNSILSSFGATDLAARPGVDLVKNWVSNAPRRRRRSGSIRVLSALSRVMSRLLPHSHPYDASVEQLRFLAYEFARLRGQRAGAPLEALDCSLVGNPEDVFKVDGRSYTMSMLYYYLRYAFCSQHVDFKSIDRVMELGSGSGKQVEVIKKLHPQLTFLLFDLPPQLYVCEMYLNTVFPGAVVSYRDTRKRENLTDLEPGKIYMFGNWKFPLTEELGVVDLFWNAASFQEMEPHVVANYLSHVDQTAARVYLQETMEGKEVARRPGTTGVLRKTALEDYRRGLPHFELTDLSPCWTPLGPLAGYSDSFWKRTGKRTPMSPAGSAEEKTQPN